ncbi:MAG: Pyrrolidone-carboxylate peptidase [Planctomycetes bacterium]|nr:Pyrrolidone-carboxylate peptidase [Planctomycetota bacterium]
MKKDARRFLVTGFLPFAGADHNPSQIVAESLAKDRRVTALVLPVSWTRAFPPVAAALARRRWDGVLHLGLGTGRSHLEVERFAVNWRAAPIPDEDGSPDPDSPVVRGGRAAYAVSADVPALVAAGRAATPLVRASCHAGTFICNLVYYLSLRASSRSARPAPTAFVHLPSFAETGGPVPRAAQIAAAAAMLEAFPVRPRGR